MEMHLTYKCKIAIAIAFTSKQPWHLQQAVIWWGLAVEGLMLRFLILVKWNNLTLLV
jgi:hypothetical protein